MRCTARRTQASEPTLIASGLPAKTSNASFFFFTLFCESSNSLVVLLLLGVVDNIFRSGIIQFFLFENMMARVVGFWDFGPKSDDYS